MFQFRRFPAYAYLIQRTLTGYCPAGLPHSEIRGSRDICSSPRLIAACHVLRRLLMPRHSPCALFSLTFVEETRSIPSSPSVRIPYPLLPSPPSPKTGFWRPWGQKTRDGSSLPQRPFTEIAILMNYAGFTKKFRNCNCYPSSFRMLFHNQITLRAVSSACLSVALLAFITLFSFQGAVSPASFEARSQNPNSFGF